MTVIRDLKSAAREQQELTKALQEELKAEKEHGKRTRTNRIYSLFCFLIPPVLEQQTRFVYTEMQKMQAELAALREGRK